MNAVTLDNITKTYNKDKVLAVDKATFEITEGETFGLIGPDGAGKTSIFRVLTTLLLPDGGSATVAGHDVVKEYEAIRNCVGYMPGRFSLYQDLTVEENLNFFATIFNTSIEENYELIKDIYVQIEPFKTRRAGKLSGGMKQKLALCCALIHKPLVLFLDEPTTGVDAVSRVEFWDMLKRLKHQGISILVSTPYMDEAALCDRIALIEGGKILSIESPANTVKKYPGKLYAVKAKNMHQLLNDLRSYEGTRSCFTFGDSYAFRFKRDSDDAVSTLTNYLSGKGHQQLEIEEIPAGIEDYFIRLRKKLKRQMDNSIAIQADKLTKRFGDFTAVDAITFDVKQGEIFGFVGANGAGKTTAMRILCGLSIPTSGIATVAGFDVYKEAEKIKKNIGYMSQKFSLYEDLTVMENITFYAGIYGLSDIEIKERSAELLDKLGIAHEAKTFVSSLPLGWKQKLAFSVAVFHRPKIVFLDEPTGGVDPVTRRQFWDLIYEAADRNITVFVTTHYMDEAEYCNRVSVMVDGRIDAFDTPLNLKKRFSVDSMNKVFYQLARGAKRKAD